MSRNRGTCTCAGYGVWEGSKYPKAPGAFTPGRRGPSPGYCGACGNHIPRGDDESNRIYEELINGLKA